MGERERTERISFVKRYEYLLIYIAIVSTVTLIVAFLDG